MAIGFLREVSAPPGGEDGKRVLEIGGRQEDEGQGRREGIGEERVAGKERRSIGGEARRKR